MLNFVAMRLHTILLTLLIIVSIINTNAQRVSRTTTPAGSVYPDVSITNLITMLNINLSDWERNMKLISKLRDDFGERGIQYTIENKTDTQDGFCFATKKATEFEMVYQIGPNGASIFTDFIKEIKKSYVKDLDGYQIYQYEHVDDINYVFVVKTNGTEEYVRVYANL